MLSRKTIRQEGLIDQNRLSELNISLRSDGKFKHLKKEIEIMASHLGAKKPNKLSSIDESDFIIFIGDAKYEDTVEIPYSRVLIMDDGIVLTKNWSTKSGNPTEIQEPGFSTIAAALVWQEVLRQTKCILPIEIPKKYIDVNFRIDPSNIPFGEINEYISLLDKNDKKYDFQTINRQDSSGHILMKLRLEEGDELADRVLQSFKFILNAVDDAIPSPSELRLTIPRVDSKISGNAIIAGVGGLGSWALHVFSEGIHNSKNDTNDLTINIIDPDMNIEIHNLNRQVLYDETDLGYPKAEKAAMKIQEILPKTVINSFIGRLDPSHLDSLDDNSTQFLEEEYSEEDYIVDDELAISNINDEFQEIISRADVILCGVDNLRARTVLNAIASKCNITMINAGAQGFKGNFDIFENNNSCMLCRYGIQAVTNRRPMSCQEDGEIPFTSIVTSTAILGALEGLALISILSEEKSLIEWPSNIRWNGRTNNFKIIDEKKYGMFSEMFLSQGSHSKHLKDKLFEI